MELDGMDRIAAEAFEGYVVRKDLALRFKGQYPVPTYVGEFLLGRYCASTDEEEILEGLAIVERQLRERTVRAGEEELYKARAREKGSVRIIDLVTARLDSKTDSYLATLPSLRLRDVRIDAELVSRNERMLTGGFYAEVELEYDPIIAQEGGGYPFGVATFRPIQLSTRSALEHLSRGRESIRADGGIVMVGNFSVDVEHQQRIGHLFGPMPPEMRDDTALMDRIHAYLPGWDVPKMNAGLFTKHFGLVSDFLSECWSSLRSESRVSVLQGRVRLGSSLSGRDTTAVRKTVSGLLKLLYPNPLKPVEEEDLEWAVRLSLECRRRVKEQQKRIGSAEFRNTHFSYALGENDVEHYIATPEVRGEAEIDEDPLSPGQVWGISAGDGSGDKYAGLFRVDVNVWPGTGVRILNQPAPAAFRESIRYAEQNLYAHAQGLVGDRDPRSHEFSVQLRAFDAARNGAHLGLPALLALCGALIGESLKGGLVVVGGLNLGGGIDPVYNALEVAELAIEKGASTLLVPISARRQLNDLSDEMATKLTLLFYSDAREGLIKAL